MHGIAAVRDSAAKDKRRSKAIYESDGALKVGGHRHEASVVQRQPAIVCPCGPTFGKIPPLYQCLRLTDLGSLRLLKAALPARWASPLSVGFRPTTDGSTTTLHRILSPPSTPPGWRIGYPFIGPIRGCNRVVRPTPVLTHQRPHTHNSRPRAWAKGTDTRSTSPAHTLARNTTQKTLQQP